MVSNDWQADVELWNIDVMGDDHKEGKSYPHVMSTEKQDFWNRLIDEEVNRELLPALKNGNLVGMADGAADAIVVILGAMSSAGIRLQPIWDEVQRTNMLKKGGYKREGDGKWMKPQGWQPPQIETLLIAQGMEWRDKR